MSSPLYLFSSGYPTPNRRLKSHWDRAVFCSFYLHYQSNYSISPQRGLNHIGSPSSIVERHHYSYSPLGFPLGRAKFDSYRRPALLAEPVPNKKSLSNMHSIS